MNKFEIYKKFFHWLARELNIPLRDIVISFYYEPHEKFNGTFCHENGIGFVDVYDIDRSILSVLTTISHEFIHCQQFFNEDFYISETEVLFRGIWYNPKDLDYRNQPWEIDAFSRENVVLTKFLLENLDIYVLIIEEELKRKSNENRFSFRFASGIQKLFRNFGFTEKNKLIGYRYNFGCRRSSS